MALFILILLLAILLFGLGFAIKWLFIAAIIALLMSAFAYPRR